MMWVGLIPLVFGKMWVNHVVLVSRGIEWVEAFGGDAPGDFLLPFWPFGAAAFLLVPLLVLEPWRGIQRQYRCGWWPAVSVVSVLLYAGVLYGAGLLAL